MATLFISDIHLEESRPEAMQWLTVFLSGPAREAEAVYILGDLFEYWIGDDAPPTAAHELARYTATLAAAGVPCFFLHGNRDFLLGEAYAGEAGLRLLPESLVVNLYGQPTLLLHGDTLCTDDVDYQAFRRQSRDPEWQQNILALPVEQRLRLAGEARDASRAHMGSAAMEIMDVNELAVREAFRTHGVHRMIHGHTHRPAVHRHDLGGGREGERIVLADWYDRGSYLEVTAEGARSIDL
jgi:UDP-2,3-diacylglucosamine hydrolase